MPDSTLTLRRASVSRKGGHWQHEDYDVFDGERCVGRIFLDANHTWFWGVSFQLTGRKSYGHVASLEEAKAAFRAEYEAWKSGPPMTINAGRPWSPMGVARLWRDVEHDIAAEEIARFLARDVEEVRAKVTELKPSPETPGAS